MLDTQILQHQARELAYHYISQSEGHHTPEGFYEKVKEMQAVFYKLLKDKQ